MLKKNPSLGLGYTLDPIKSRLLQVARSFTQNLANRGGAITAWTSTLNIANSSFENTSGFASEGSSALYTDGYGSATVTVENSTFLNNATAIYAEAGTASVNLNHVTIADNFAGITSNSTVTLSNTILGAHTGTSCLGSGTFISNGNNIEAGGNNCNLMADGSNGDLPNTDPLLGDFVTGPDERVYYPLLAASPAIDAAEGSLLDVDQRGEFRPTDGDGDGVAVADIGAFELIPNIDLNDGSSSGGSTSGEGNTGDGCSLSPAASVSSFNLVWILLGLTWLAWRKRQHIL